MWKTVLGVLVAFSVADVACANSLSVFSKGVSWTADDNPSCQLLLGIKSVDTPSLLIIGWQLTCRIVAEQDATGLVWFGSVVEPSGHVFDEMDNQFERSPDSDTSRLVVMDDIFLCPVPVTVPSAGVSLLQIELKSYQAVGRFDVQIMGINQEPGSFWYSDTFETMPFAIVASPGRSPDVVESLVFVAVPEPSTMVLLLAAGTASILSLGWRRQGKKTLTER